MILVCPFCHARYLISASLFANGPRSVRCVRCSHKWAATADEETLRAELASLLDITPSPEKVAPIPQGSNLPAVATKMLPLWAQRTLRIAGGILALSVVLIFILARQDLAKEWPFLEGLYETLGLHIYQAGEGLQIKNVRSELRYEDGIMRLMVQGDIYNDTKKDQLVPPLVASAIGSSGDIMQSWQIDPPVARLESKGSVAFSSTINTPKGTVVEINLNFVEASNASE